MDMFPIPPTNNIDPVTKITVLSGVPLGCPCLNVDRCGGEVQQRSTDDRLHEPKRLD
jgi:hypothetical protein